MLLLWHPWLTTTNLSYSFPLLETSATASCGTTGTVDLCYWVIGLSVLSRNRVWKPGVCLIWNAFKFRPECHLGLHITDDFSVGEAVKTSSTSVLRGQGHVVHTCKAREVSKRCWECTVSHSAKYEQEKNACWLCSDSSWWKQPLSGKQRQIIYTKWTNDQKRRSNEPSEWQTWDRHYILLHSQGQGRPVFVFRNTIGSASQHKKQLGFPQFSKWDGTPSQFSPLHMENATCTTIGHEILPPGHQLRQPATKMHPLTKALASHSHSTQMQCCELATWPKKLAIASATSYKHQGPNHENIWNLQMNRLNDGRQLIEGSLVAKVPSYGDSKSSREISEPRDQSSTNQSITSKVISHWFSIWKTVFTVYVEGFVPLALCTSPLLLSTAHPALYSSTQV